MTRGRMHVCLICHTEPDVWDGGFASIDRVRPLFLEMLASVRDVRGLSPRVAWCLTGQVMRHRADVFRALADLGHEIGVHSHYPAEDGRLEHRQELNREHLDHFARWFPALCDLAAEMGLPRPRVHASWMFAYREEMTRPLAECGITVDASVCYGSAHHLPEGFLLADSRARTSGKPYRLAWHDHCAEGDSPVVELPVSGGFGDYWEVVEGQFCHFPPILSDSDRDRQLRLFRARLDGLLPGEIDILHIHLHLYEFLSPGGFAPDRLRRAHSLLEALAQDDRVRFSTPSQAVEAWESGRVSD